MRRCVVWRTTGSPPRAWGQCLQPAPQAPSRRFTPTGVGTMMCSSYCTISASVHPHGRGDNYVPGSASGALYGSPPRAWGQSRPDRCVPLVGRFTPTGVGTMRTSRRSLTYSSVHPHGRGDNVLRVVLPLSVGGSPPRAWGQSTRRFAHAPPARFTPTGVGTITARGRNTYCRAVHPHGRGDNVIHYSRQCKSYGSPPRAWGQCVLDRVACVPVRFTPTGVGTIGICRTRTGNSPVHPHGRWDNARSVKVCIPPLGSPPRAWGQFLAVILCARLVRFTPTGVGTIPAHTPTSHQHTVHPHGRGDNVTGRPMCTAGSVHPHGRGDNRSAHRHWLIPRGSPPRAWGQYRQSAALGAHMRFTPTGVGTIRCRGQPGMNVTVHPHGRGDN